MRVMEVMSPMPVVAPASIKKDNSFGSVLQKALADVNNFQQEAQLANRRLALGERDDLYQVILTAEKAEIALQFTLQVRNKLIEAYQEIMRMQV